MPLPPRVNPSNPRALQSNGFPRIVADTFAKPPRCKEARLTLTAASALALLVLFQIKHMFADYFLQTPKMLTGREKYWHMGRAQHAGVHLIGSVLVLLPFGLTPVFFVVLVVTEWVVHFNIDWAKARYSMARQHTPIDAGFWQAAGVDQALHQLTYIAMVWAIDAKYGWVG